ncbi:unnamed protein product [Phytophthora fragariaefolia]|uniref:Unnamed protein product n=1 Tax=Phytophthora fragariaefolia TaxID=1490495 RepID=A0A9W7CKN1_9STRA|nr:unnamed protein product [Phytophthora fragariaefolia]
MGDGEEDEETSSSKRDDPSVGSRRPHEYDSDASSSKRSRSNSDRPHAVAEPLSSPRAGDDSIPSGVETPRTAPLRWYRNKSTSHRSRVPEWEALGQSLGAFVDNFNSNPAGYRERIRFARERYEVISKRPKIERLYRGAVEAGNPCAVPMGIACSTATSGQCACPNGTLTGVRVPEELKALRTSLIAQTSSSSGGGRSAPSRTVGDYSSRPSFTPFGGFGGGGLRTPSPLSERPASGRSAAPTYRGSEEILTNEYENDPDPRSGSDDQQFVGRSSEFPPVRLAVGVEAARRRRGSGPPDSVDRLEAVERLQSADFAALRQEMALLKAQLAQVSQTASDVQVDLGSKLAVLRTRTRAGVGAGSPRLGDSCCA